MATRPATAPETAPRVVKWPVLIRSMMSQPSMAAAAARLVFMNAVAARLVAPSADPALNPNQPNHRMPGAQHRERQRVGQHRLARPAAPLAEHQHHRQRRRCRR